ncbi:RluA family pseudouridine synthase [Virgibacillus kekensis]|uniref:Pseudouridine synthase n=1 Tax=Virgibacillus kekensis TaxID=202261 RepID=A0ABV9DD99_9BACI
MQKKNRKSQSDKTLEYKVGEPAELLKFLLTALSNRSRNSVKSILARGQVTVDDHIETQYNYELQPGQRVTILKNKAAVKQDALIGMEIVYEDEHLIVINKEAGLLSIANEKEKERTAHHQLMEYVRREHPQNRIFVVHRLDKDTSGVMMFAKSEKVKHILQDDWKRNVTERTYMALVEGKVAKHQYKITSWLRESKTRLMYSSQTKNDGLYAATQYKVVQQNEEFSLLEVQLETGRKNQIRVHMQDIGHPVVGDKKYGSKSKGLRRLGLHAKVLAFKHPITGKQMRFEADVPKSFLTKSK